MLTSTASIGLAVLKSAIGLRKNYKEIYIEEHVDLNATGCCHCMHFINSSAHKCVTDQFPFSEHCSVCANRVMHSEKKTVYVNERNRYGQRHELRKNALLLLMYLHYLNPDKSGLLYINIEDAASVLHCTERTIKNNLKLLHKYEYIALASDPVYPGYYKMFLPEISTYYLPANNGGRGYCVFPKDVFNMLIELPDINSIRLAIRNLIPETLFNKDKKVEKSYIEIQRDLPAYCSKNKIKALTSTENFCRMFDVKHKKYFISIRVKNAYDVTNIASVYKAECRDKVLTLVKDLQSKAERKKSRHKLLILEEELNDICNIALKVPIQFIEQALKQINDQYIMNKLPVINLGALVRTIATELYQVAI